VHEVITDKIEKNTAKLKVIRLYINSPFSLNIREVHKLGHRSDNRVSLFFIIIDSIDSVNALRRGI